MVNYELRELMKKMTDDERVACANMLLGGRVRRLLWRDRQADIKVMILGYEFGQLPDMYEINVNDTYYFDASFDNVFRLAIMEEPKFDMILMDIQEKIRLSDYSSVFWRKYPLWNKEIW